MKTTQIGTISIPVDTYEGSDGKSKTISRAIGKLCMTEDDDGAVHYWGDISAEYLNPVLAGAAANVERRRRKAAEKSTEHRQLAIPFRVWEDRDRKPPRQASRESSNEPQEEADEVPF